MFVTYNLPWGFGGSLGGGSGHKSSRALPAGRSRAMGGGQKCEIGPGGSQQQSEGQPTPPRTYDRHWASLFAHMSKNPAGIVACPIVGFTSVEPIIEFESFFNVLLGTIVGESWRVTRTSPF